jgi:glucose dehydrogenase
MKQYDVVIVGAGIAGTIIARELGQQGKSVLILEGGPKEPPTNREKYLENFFLNINKTPESPYPPLDEDPAKEPTPRATIQDSFSSNIEPGFPDNLQQPDGFIFDPAKSYLLQKGPHPFASTYERVAGGTTWHWLGTSLRFLEHDFTMRTTYGVEKDWPITDQDLLEAYNEAEKEIGVSANARVQEKDLGPIGLRYAPPDYQYPMQEIPLSLVDEAVAGAVDGQKDFVDFEGLNVEVTSTPAGRNSQSLGADSRRVCAGNTNCIPICPIQAKYDATVTLAEAQQTGNVDILTQTVANRVVVDENGNVSGIEYLQWEGTPENVTRRTPGVATGKVYVLAAHAIETPRLLLMSRRDDQGALSNGVANSSDQVGRNLMDHPLYLSWALMRDRVWGYRGPLTTSGIETLRDGAFRSERAAWRVEIGNEGWNFSIGDPWTTTGDFINGTNNSQLNPQTNTLFGDALVHQLNDVFPRQWRMGFLVEQTPEPGNRITLSGGYTDGLGLPRPVIHYDLSEYTKAGFVYAEIFARQVYQRLDARNYTQNPQQVAGPGGKMVDNPTYFPLDNPEWTKLFEQLPKELKDPKYTNLSAASGGVPEGFQYFGSGHIVGTTVFGTDAKTSVLNKDQQSWDHPNLFMVGSGVFPTITTANPTLTIAALAFKAAAAIAKELA